LQLLKKETKNYDIAGGGGEVGEEVQKSEHESGRQADTPRSGPNSKGAGRRLLLEKSIHTGCVYFGAPRFRIGRRGNQTRIAFVDRSAAELRRPMLKWSLFVKKQLS